jgi:hypothetical protein
LSPVRVDASSITITNVIDTTSAFFTTVSGSVGLIPDVHLLVDIPGTPWDSSSTIIEVPHPIGPLPDILNFNWTIQHLIGPVPGFDINPNPNEPLTLAIRFIPTASGGFGFSTVRPGGFQTCNFPLGSVPVFTEIVVGHPNTAGLPKFDDLCLNVFGFVGSDLLGGLNINFYTIEYFAQHCDVLDPVTGTCPPLGFNLIPEQPALVLVGSGLLLLSVGSRGIARRRRRTMNSPGV